MQRLVKDIRLPNRRSSLGMEDQLIGILKAIPYEGSQLPQRFLAFPIREPDRSIGANVLALPYRVSPLTCGLVYPDCSGTEVDIVHPQRGQFRESQSGRR